MHRLVVVDLVLRDLNDAFEVVDLVGDWNKLQLQWIVSLRTGWVLLRACIMRFLLWTVEVFLSLECCLDERLGRLCLLLLPNGQSLFLL